MNQDEKAFKECAFEVSLAMAGLTTRWRERPVFLANALVDSLGAYIAMVASDPATVLALIADRLKKTDVEGIRQDHLAAKLATTAAEVIQIGAPRGKPQ